MIFTDEQWHFPDHYRLDVMLRFPFHLGRVRIEPYVSMLNATLRRNVLYYSLEQGGFRGDAPPVLEPKHILPAFPGLGLEARL